jgi:hypothetical protein
MKTNTKVFLMGALATMTMAFHSNVHADGFILCDDGRKVQDQDAEQKKRSWSTRFKEQIMGTELKYSLNLPTLSLGDVDFNLGVQRSSDQSYGKGKYSQADQWNLGVSYNPALWSSRGPHLGIAETVTYIRQFENRKDSFCRDLPFYDIRDKVPQKAADFDLATNIHALKKNDFIEFKSHLTLGIPEFLQKRIGLTSPFSVTGMFEVQIFRMDENLVRVRVGTIKDKRGSLGIKYQLFDGGLLGRMSKVELKFLEKADSDLLVYDMVFNFDPRLKLENERAGVQTAADLYDKFIGSQLQMDLTGDNLERLLKQARNNNPFNERAQKFLRENMKTIVDISLGDAKALAFNQRSGLGQRVYMINNGNLSSTSMGNGIELNFLRLVSLKLQQSEYESMLTIWDSKNEIAKYILQGTGRHSSWKVIKLWGDTFETNTNLVMTAPKDAELPKPDMTPLLSNEHDYPTNKPPEEITMPVTDVYGMNISRNVEFKEINKDEAKHIVQKLRDTLTDKIFGRMNWGTKTVIVDGKETKVNILPKWESFESNAQTNVKIRQNIMFKGSLFKRNIVNSPAEVQVRVNEILQIKAENLENLKAKPSALSGLIEGDDNVPRVEINLANGKKKYMTMYEALRQRYYLTAYLNDVQYISNGLYQILSSNLTSEKYKVYNTLTKNELFMEIGGVILMYVAENFLDSDIVIRLSVQASGRDSIIGYYPSREDYDKLRDLTAILDYQNYLSDRSYNLKNYIKEDGSAYTLTDLLQNPLSGNLRQE